MSIFDRKFYDYIISPTAGGGDYSTLTTANFTAMGAGAKIFITGDYTITSDFDFADNQNIYWDDVTLTLNGCRATIPATFTTGGRWEGKLTIGGTGSNGSSVQGSLFVMNSASKNLNAINCEIHLDYSTVADTTYLMPFYTHGLYHSFNIVVNELSRNYAVNFYSLIEQIASDSYIKFKAVNIDWQANVDFTGFRSGGDRCNIEVLIYDLTGTKANTLGLVQYSGADHNTYYGTIEGCNTNANFGVGTNQNVAALNVA